MQHVEKLKLIVSRENPKWIICDAGYGKTKNQILMRYYPGRVWSAFIDSGSNINHTAMCENAEAIINRRNLGIS